MDSNIFVSYTCLGSRQKMLIRSSSNISLPESSRLVSNYRINKQPLHDYTVYRRSPFFSLAHKQSPQTKTTFSALNVGYLLLNLIGLWIFFLELFCIYPIYSSNVVFEMRTWFRQISALDGEMVCHKSIQASPFLIIIRNDFNKSNIPISILISCMKLFLTLIFSNEVLVVWQRMAEVPKSCTVIQETGWQSM